MRWQGKRAAFTLLELMVVMALVAAIFSIVAPSLSAFFANRELHNEARRLLALTRFARSQSVSVGAAMEIWVAPKEGTYGLATKDGYTAPQAQEPEFHLADRLQFDVDPALLDDQGKLRIEFWPDGVVEGPEVILREERGPALSVQPADVGQGYVIVEADETSGQRAVGMN